MDLDAYERRFRRARLPKLVEDRTAREDRWTRASPVLGVVLIVEVLLARAETMIASTSGPKSAFGR